MRKEKKKKNENVVEIMEDVRIPNSDIILEKGDRIEVLKERERVEPTSERDLLVQVENAFKTFAEPSGFPYSLTENIESHTSFLIREMLGEGDYDDYSEEGSFLIEMNISEEKIKDFLNETYEELGSDKLVDWLSKEKYRTTYWVDTALEYMDENDMQIDDFEDLVNLARKLAIMDGMESLIRHINKVVDGIYWEH